MSAVTALPSPIAASLQNDAGEALSLRVEAVHGTVHVRLRHASVPPGLDHGPRVTMELSPADARRLGLALVATADQLGPEVRA